MTGKERWRKTLSTMDLDPFMKSWLSRGLREIHHVNDNMDGRMDACLGYSAVLGAESFRAVEELQGEFVEDRKKRALDGWERMDVKRSLEESLRDVQIENADLKSRVEALERFVLRLTDPRSDPPKEATFRLASPLPNIRYPPESLVPGLTTNQAVVDDYLDWSSFDRTWPHGGYEADGEGDVEAGSNKENSWVAVPVSK